MTVGTETWVLRAAPLIGVWLAMARSAGVHSGALDLPPHRDRLVLGAWSVDEAPLRLRCDARWESRYGHERREWDGPLCFTADWTLGPDGLVLSDLTPDDDTTSMLLAWGADTAQAGLREAVVGAVGAMLARPIPVGVEARRIGPCVVLGDGPAAEINDAAGPAWVRRHLPGGVKLTARGDVWSLTAGARKLRWTGGVPDLTGFGLPTRWVLPLVSRPMDTLHTEEHGVRLELRPVDLRGGLAILELTATPWRERRPLGVTLDGVARGERGEVTRLMLRTSVGQVELPLAHARAARAKGTLGPAQVAVPLDTETRALLLGFGLIVG